MKPRIISILTILILTITTVYGQSFEPLDLAKKIFGKDNLPNIDSYISGEYKGQPNGQDLQKNSITKFILLGQTQKTAVIGMTVLDSTGKGLDTYLHFKKDTVWKMTAFRTLAMTGMIEQVKIGLEKMTLQQVGDIVAKSKKKKKDKFAMFTSIEDYNFQLGNAKLILELDDNIARHFLTNKVEFERLKNLAFAQLETEKINEQETINLIENLKVDYRKLFISSVSNGGYELKNCISFLIGGILDNSVGYLYVKDKKNLPEMSPSAIIMIREIGNGWYIYKTT